MYAVLFDFYKTVFKPILSESEATRNFLLKAKEFLANQGYDIDLSKIETAFNDSVCIFEKIRKVSLFDVPVDILIKSFSVRIGIHEEQIVNKLLQLYTDALVNSIEPYSDAEQALKIIKEHDIKIGIVSNAHQRYFIRESFIRYKLDRYVDYWFISGEIGLRKPNPQIFLYATKKMGTSPKNTFMVGDDFISDFYGASLAGLTPILIIRDNSLSKVIRFIKEGYIARTLVESTEKILEHINLKHR